MGCPLLDVLPFNGDDLVDAAGVAPAAERGREPGLHDLPGKIHPDQSGSQCQHVRVVVLAAVDGRGIVVGHAGAHSGDLVGHDAAADSGAVDDDAAPGAARAHQVRDRMGKVGIIHGFLAVSAHIDDIKTHRRQICFEHLPSAQNRRDRHRWRQLCAPRPPVRPADPVLHNYSASEAAIF